MLNLLLREDRYDLKKEYTLRFFNILLIFSILALLVFGILLFSISSFIWVENKVVNEQLATISENDNTQKRNDLHKMIDQINNKISFFNQPKPEYSTFLNEILKMVPSGVVLNGINFMPILNEDSGFIKIEITAEARLRENMVQYSNNLKENPNFVEINLPVSNLAKDTDVIFRITMNTLVLESENLKKNPDVVDTNPNEIENE
jgi:hypothetical protein